MLKFFILSLFFLCTSAHALQVKAAKDNETLLFIISAKDYSKILVTGDRIISVKGKNHLYEVKEFKGQHDEGVLYLRPTFPQKKFSLFITTVQGHHFTLFLQTMDTPAETIEIKPLSSAKTIATQWEANLPYTQKMLELMRAMVSETQPEGYAVIELKKAKPTKKGKGLASKGLGMQLVTLYRGGFLQGEVWKLKNEIGHTLYLHPRQFYHNKVRASSLGNETLRKSEETMLYRIVGNE